jgi:hypothetical protein
MRKRGIIKLLVLLILLLIGGFIYFLKNYDFAIDATRTESENNCVLDEDCVPSSCCHADSCVMRTEAPKCEGTFCTEECEPNTLDCAQAVCKCTEGKCEARLR